jgi:hypothetical protein
MARSGTVVHHQSHLDRFSNVLTRDSELIALGQVVIHTGVAVGCRCGTHCHKLLHPLVHLYHSKYPGLLAASADFPVCALMWIKVLGSKIRHPSFGAYHQKPQAGRSVRPQD